MKLYSRSQVIRRTLLCVAAAVLLTAVISIKITKKNIKKAQGETVVEVSDNQEAQLEQEKSTVSFDESVGSLETNPSDRKGQCRLLAVKQLGCRQGNAFLPARTHR